MSNNRGVYLFIARRLAFGVLTLFVVSLLVFACNSASAERPGAGHPRPRRQPDQRRRASPEARSRSHRVLPVHTLAEGASSLGDPGDSFNARVPILDYIGDRVINSLFLLMLGVCHLDPAGAVARFSYSAHKRDSTFDNVSSNVMLALASLPEFVIGIILVLMFSVRLWHVLAGGQRDRHRRKGRGPT